MRNINLLLKKYLEHGRIAFIHKNSGRIPAKAFSREFENEILELYKTKYFDFNYAHFRDKLREDEGIVTSYSYLRTFLLKNDIYSLRLHRKTRKELKKKFALLEQSKKITNAEIELHKASIMKLEESHPMQNRKEFFGERIQGDASRHIWFGDSYSHLIGFIDDATGRIIDLIFDKEETLQGYYQISKTMFTEYGIPMEILTDKRTIFWSLKEKEPASNSDSLTQYGFVCHNLGIKLTTTSVPQTKGRIERLWETLQDRLVKELRLKNISTIEKANIFLKEFIVKYNDQFSIPFNNIKSVFEKLDEKDNLDFILSRRSERIVNKGGTIKYKNKFYIPYLGDEPVIFKNKHNLFVVETFTDQLYSNSYNDWMPLVEVKQNFTFKSLFEEIPENKKAKPLRTPSPWKYTNWIFYNSKKPKNVNFEK